MITAASSPTTVTLCATCMKDIASRFTVDDEGAVRCLACTRKLLKEKVKWV